MPDIGPFHPQIVHFVVALGMVGVALRVISLSGWPAWSRPAGTALLLGAALASVLAVQSGQDAHGPVERVPGSREAVQKHEELGERTRNLFLVVAAIELVALGLRKRERTHRFLLAGSAVAGLATAYFLFEAAEHGGELVYSYAGGIGLRTGDPEDTHRLLIAGLYHEARTARDAGRHDEAARLTDELIRQVPNDQGVAMLAIESMIRDRNDPQGALAALAAIPVPANNPRFEFQSGLLRSEALAAAGQPDSARAVLQALSQKFPESRSIREALDKLK